MATIKAEQMSSTNPGAGPSLSRRLTSALSQAGLLRLALLLIGAVLVFVLCVVPFLNLFFKIAFFGDRFSLEIFSDLTQVKAVRTATLNTLKVALTITIASVGVAVPLAWLLTRWDFPFASKFRSYLCLPYAIPPYVGAIAWIFLANPMTGLLNHLLGASVLNIYSFTGLVFVETCFLYTFVLIASLASLDRMDSSLEEAARLSGASPLRVFRDITLPLLKPTLIGSSLLVFLAAVASFGVPALIGGPARLYLLTTQIYTYQRMGSMSGLLRAAALSIWLMVAALVLMIAAHYISTRKTLQTVGGKTARPSNFELGRLKTPLVILVCLFLGVVFILPIFGVLLSSLSQTQGELGLSNLTLSNWHRILFEVSETPRALSNSLIAAAAAATLASVVAMFVAYVQVKTKIRGRALFEIFASLPSATPGTVVALALIMTFSISFLGVIPSLYNTLALIIVAYFVKYLSFSVRTVGDGYRQIDDVLAEAARMSGANGRQTMMTIWLPLLMPALVASWFLVFMPALSEMTMTLLLTGPGLETIGTLTFQLQEYADASGGGASVLAIIVVFAVIVINTLVKRLSRGKFGL